MNVPKKDLPARAEAWKREASALLRPLGRPDVEEDVLAVPVIFKDDRRVSRCGGFCHDGGVGYLSGIVVYTHNGTDEARIRRTVMHELAHAVVHFMRPEGENPPHANPLWKFAMELLGFPMTMEECRNDDRHMGYRFKDPKSGRWK